MRKKPLLMMPSVLALAIGMTLPAANAAVNTNAIIVGSESQWWNTYKVILANDGSNPIELRDAKIVFDSNISVSTPSWTAQGISYPSLAFSSDAQGGVFSNTLSLSFTEGSWVKSQLQAGEKIELTLGVNGVMDLALLQSTIRLVANDGGDEGGEPELSLQLASPTNGAEFEEGQTVAIKANVKATNTSVKLVNFLVDGKPVATVTKAPFQANWKAIGVGAHTIKAMVEDTSGLVQEQSVEIKVKAEEVGQPSVSIQLASPVNGAEFDEGQSVAIKANVKATNTTVKAVTFHVDDKKVASVTKAPFEANWIATGEGAHTVKAIVEDASGVKKEQSVRITVKAEEVVPPVVPGNVIPFVPGQTQVNNGDMVLFNDKCFIAKNNPGVWESPTADSWFWDEVACPGEPDLENHAPTIEALSTIKAVAGEAISVNVMAFDVDSDPIYFSLTENPVFVSINAESGLMTLTPDYFDSGSYQFTVVASDQKLETTRKITVVVSENPVQKALETGEHSYATETQLLDFAVKQIEDDISVSVRILNKLYENLESGVTWHPSRNSQWITNYSASLNNNTRFMVGNRYENGNAANVTLGIVGEKPIGQRYAYTTGHPLVVDQNNNGIAQLMKNTFSWLTETKPDSDGKLNVVLVNQHSLYNNTVNWFNQNYPDAYTINTDKACDDGKLMSCLNEDVDLVIFANTGYASGQEEAFSAAYDKMEEMNIPFYFASTTHHVHSPLLMHVIRDIGIISLDTNYWNKAQLVASSPSDILPTGEDARVTFLNKMKERSFDPSILSTCNANYIFCTSSQFLNGFKNAADLLRSDVTYYDSSNTNVFELDQLELVKTTLLLADKYRSLIDYPIARSSEPEEFFKALFADWYVLYSRPNNAAQPDLGEYVVDKSQISKGTNAHYAYPETVTRSQVNTVPYTKQWTSTGWYALPSKTVTLTRTGEDTHKVVVRLYYARNNTNRTYSDGWYNKHQDMTIGRFAIPPKGSVTFSTPYGAPIYLYHEGGNGGELSTEITATGVAEHPAVTDFTDPNQLTRFAELYNNTEIPHVDLKLTNAEQHLRRDRFASAIGSTYPDVGALLKGIQEDHIETAYSLAGLKVDGKTLDESVATGAMAACKSKFGAEDCTDENLHIRKIIQHSNYDQNAQCGVGCAGNPWDSGSGISPRGWLDNHELGHNLQTSLLNVAYVTEANRNNWTQYQSRAGENSNNIFPYYSAWKGYYLTDGNTGTIYDGHQDAKLTYFAYQSDKEELRNANGERVVYFPTCSVAATAKTRHESIWAGNAYSENNGYRMAFYIQLALRADELETMIDGSVLDTGWDIYPVLYQHARIYAKYARNESDWLANRDKLGFDLFDYSVNNSNVTGINGNDFMLVSLSYLTGYDWSTHFDVWGLRNSDLALQQAAKHGVKGKLPLGMYVHERDFPTANLSDGLDFLPLGEKGVKWTRDESTPVNCATK